MSLNNQAPINPLHEAARRVVAIASKMIPDRPFYDYQQEFALALTVAVLECDPTELTALFSRQSGKTETAARILATLSIMIPMLVAIFPKQLAIYKTGFWIGVFAPIKAQADTTFSRVVEVIEGQPFQALMLEFKVGLEKSNSQIRKFSNGSFICIRSASKNSMIEGLTLHIALIEESQDVGAVKIRKSIDPMLTATQGTMVHVGTANTLRSEFYETIQKNKLLQIQNKIKRKRHFQFDWKVVIKRSKAYYRSLNKKFEEHGISLLETDAFQMAYGCKFLLARGQFISPERFTALMEIGKAFGRAVYNGEFFEHEGKTYRRYNSKFKCYAGIDWGKSSDSTVVTIIEKRMDHFRVVDWLELVGDDYESQKIAILIFLMRYALNLEVIAGESNSMGDPMVDWMKGLKKDGKLKAAIFAFFTTAASKSDGFVKLSKSFVSVKPKTPLLFPADEKTVKSREFQAFQKQCLKLEKTWRGSLMVVGHPEGPEEHDDYCISLMIAHWAASQVSTSELWELFDSE